MEQKDNLLWKVLKSIDVKYVVFDCLERFVYVDIAGYVSLCVCRYMCVTYPQLCNY